MYESKKISYLKIFNHNYNQDDKMTRAPYKRGYSQTKNRGKQGNVTCGFCGKKTPRFKALVTFRGFTITDKTILKQMDRRNIHTYKRKIYACPACARFQGIIKKKR